MPKLQLDLIDNAIDFLLSAAENAELDEPRAWKYGLLHLVDGVELVLKARLQEEHWSLLFQDVNKASNEALARGDFQSVDLETCFKRLQGIAGVTISESEIRDLRSMGGVRNSARHFAIDIELEQLKSYLAKGLNFVLTFADANLQDGVPEDARAELYAHLQDFQEFTSERMNSIKDVLDALDYATYCDRCDQETVRLSENGPVCLFCGDRPDPEVLAASRGEGPLSWSCLACGEQTMFLVLFNNEDGAGICTTCGSHWQRVCFACGLQFYGRYDSDGLLCEECARENRPIRDPVVRVGRRRQAPEEELW